MDGIGGIFKRTTRTLLLRLEKTGYGPQSLENRIRDTFKISKEEFRWILGAVTLAALIAFVLKGGSEKPDTSDNEVEISTVIPPGSVLVPVQFQNYETLDSILGSTGVVDLFTKGPDGQNQLLVANAKVLRAPRNPSVLAVLCPQNQAAKILKADQGGLYGVVKNKSQTGTQFVNPVPSNVRKSRITYVSEEG